MFCVRMKQVLQKILKKTTNLHDLKINEMKLYGRNKKYIASSCLYKLLW